MNIFFDFEVMQKMGDLPLFEQSEVLFNALSDIRDFVKQRISVLSDKIKIEEQGITLIYVFKETDKIVKHFRYSENLTKELYDCISDKDVEFILNKIKPVIYLLPSNDQLQ